MNSNDTGIIIMLDEEMMDGTWRWEEDFRDKENKILLVAIDVYQKLQTGLIPDDLKDEIIKSTNGGSPL